jgi:electron transport complex protein RnfG
MSNNKAGGIIKLGIILALYSSIACVGLAFVYNATEKQINENAVKERNTALKDLFPGADSFKTIDGIVIPDPSPGSPKVTIKRDEGNPDDTGAYAAMKNNEIIGVALITSRASYSGLIKTLVGVGVDGKISGVKILEHSDTPGLGANAASSKYYVDRANGIRFYDQFAGKNVSDRFLPKQDVIAITAATVTSRAVAASVKAAGDAAMAWFASGANSQEGGAR